MHEKAKLEVPVRLQKILDIFNCLMAWHLCNKRNFGDHHIFFLAETVGKLLSCDTM